jgi:hypothetical protein
MISIGKRIKEQEEDEFIRLRRQNKWGLKGR